LTGEFIAIERLRRLLPVPAPGVLGIGDDAAAILLPAGWLVTTTDAVVAGVHADLDLTGLDDLGWKAIAVNVSDIAAMGARPLQAVITVVGPPDTDLDRLYQGIAEAARRYECPVVGGDLANGPGLVVSVAMTGTVPDGEPVRRTGARPGDGIYVTGSLGLSAAGLRMLRKGEKESSLAVAAYRRPTPEVAAGEAARLAGATAMIDISDGLAADLGHLADASGVGLALDEVPVGEGATLEEAVAGGEDYVLAFTAPSDPSAAFAERGLAAPVRIGTATAVPAERLLAGQPLPAAGGWEHQWR
jgi:thiamine-monophosphate kinase